MSREALAFACVAAGVFALVRRNAARAGRAPDSPIARLRRSARRAATRDTAVAREARHAADLALRADPWKVAREALLIVMVGLPARGKTFLARKIQRYLSFFHALRCEIFNVGDYRRGRIGNFQPAAFFDNSNADALRLRQECTQAACDDLRAYMTQGNDGRIAILDGTHTTRAKRAFLLRELESIGAKLIWVESICEDESVIDRNIRACKLGTPDYEGMEANAAVEDFRTRVAHYSDIYEQINQFDDESALAYIKVFECRKFVINNIRGYLPGRIVQFLTSLHMQGHEFYLSRHGQSEYNRLKKIGGDSGLSEQGDRYARRLAEFTERRICVDESTGASRPGRLWTSTLRRTKETAQYIQHPTIEIAYEGDDVNGRKQAWIQMRQRAWNNLDELFAGLCDGMTYEEIEERHPEEFMRRKADKLAYRYPRGESYLDMIHRLEPMVHEMERHREPLLIVAHQGILRLIYAFYMGLPREEAPYVSIPLNTVIKLVPGTYDCAEQRHVLLKLTKSVRNDGQNEPQSPDEPPAKPTPPKAGQSARRSARGSRDHDDNDPPSH